MPKKQSTAARRARAAARQGAKYTTALRGIDWPAAVWVLLSVRLAPSQDGHDDLLGQEDLAAVALALSGAWRYTGTPCPRAVVYPIAGSAEHTVLLTRLTFTLPDSGLTADELDRMAEAARHAVVMRGRGSATATAEPAPAGTVDQLGALAVEHGAHGPEIADRDWWRHAMVRLLHDVTTISPDAAQPTRYRAGQVLTLWQTGRQDWPIDTTQWTTSLDVDTMGFIPDDAVELVEVLEEVPPRLADAVEPVRARLARRWRRAMALVEHVAHDDTATVGDRVMVHEHRKEVTRAVLHEIGQSRQDGHVEPDLLTLAADILEQVLALGPQTADAYGGLQADQAQAEADALRALATHPDPAALDLKTRLRAAETALTQALCVDGALGVDARLTPRQRKAAQVRFGARLAAVIDAEQPDNKVGS